MNQTHSLRRHPIYSIWRNMKTRCYNPNTHNFSIYGGKGIAVCAEWINDVSAFYRWSLANGYRRGLTIDRIESARDYSPNNCRWTTRKIQQRNKTSHRGSKSKFVGVAVQFWGGKFMYVASIRVNKKGIHIGSFSDESEAAKARDNYILSNNLSGYNLNFRA